MTDLTALSMRELLDRYIEAATRHIFEGDAEAAKTMNETENEWKRRGITIGEIKDTDGRRTRWT